MNNFSKILAILLFWNVCYSQNQEKPDLFILSVGISKYQDARLNLKYAHLDAQDLAAAFSKQSVFYNIAEVKVLVNERAKRAAIRDELKNLRIKTTPNDLAIFIFSGHGLEETLVPHDFKPTDKLGTTLQKADLMELLESVGCNYIILLDACHSGSFAKNVLGKNIYPPEYQNQVQEDVRNLLDGLSRTDKAKLIIGSSASNEKSFECNSCQNGYFTQCVIDVFSNKRVADPDTNRKFVPDANNNGKISLTEFSNYLENSVAIMTKTARRSDPNVEVQKIYSRINKSTDIDFLLIRPMGQGNSTDPDPEWKRALPQMVGVAGGTFLMGCVNYSSGGYNRHCGPQHEVSVDDFWIGKYEVTNLEYSIFLNEMGNQIEIIKYPNGKEHKSYWLNFEDTGVQIETKNNFFVPKPGYESYPVVAVTWYGAKAFCSWLSEKTGENYRLLTEAEWEYAARGGKLSKGFEYSGSNNLNDVGWYNKNIKHYDGWLPDKVYSKPVGKKQANELGIFDMSGNVSEWVEDNYFDYDEDENGGAPTDGSAWVSNNPDTHGYWYHGQRGGSWFGSDYDCSVWKRYLGGPNTSWINVGFRVAKD